jgi:peptide/nickel transport system permease protein
VVETIFTVPGVGYESIHSLATRDYSLIQGTTLLLAVIFVSVNLLVDVLYVVLDPRIRLEAS